jgi:PAS domain S-box-containing protein
MTGITFTDVPGRIQCCNRAYASMLGYREDELLGRNVRELIHPEDREKNMTEIQRLLAQEIPSDRSRRATYNNLRQRGPGNWHSVARTCYKRWQIWSAFERSWPCGNQLDPQFGQGRGGDVPNDLGEHDGPAVTAPAASGFGSTVLRRVTKESLDAEVELDYGAAGLVWRLQCRAAEVLEKGRTAR